MMHKWKDFVQVQTSMGDAVCIGDVTLTPESQAVMLRWPFGGMVWTRPTAVVVQRDDAAGTAIEERIPIVDVTRVLQFGLLGLGVFFTLVAFVVSMCKIGRKGGQ